MELFQIWRLPERKIKSSEDKWIADTEIMEAKSRKDVTKTLHNELKNGTWKVRKI